MMNLLRASVLLAVSVLNAATTQSVLLFNSVGYTTGENAGTVLLTLHRTMDITSPVSVDFTTADDTATATIGAAPSAFATGFS